MNAVSMATWWGKEGMLWSQTHQATFVFAFFNLGDSPVSGVFGWRNVMPCPQLLQQIRLLLSGTVTAAGSLSSVLRTLSPVPRMAARWLLQPQAPHRGPRRKGGKRGGGTYVSSIRKATFAQDTQSRCTSYVSLTRTGSRGHSDAREAGEVGTRLSW